jgi:hypothetical protein
MLDRSGHGSACDERSWVLGWCMLLLKVRHSVACDKTSAVVGFVMLDISRHGVTCDKSTGSRVALVMLDGSRHGVPCDRSIGTPTKQQVSKRPVSKRLKRQVYKTSGLRNVSLSKRQVFKTSGCKKNHIYSVLVVAGNPQVLLQPCLMAVFF